MQQPANGVSTQYTLDLSPAGTSGSGLTQVLQENGNTYLYGNGRIAQMAETQAGYFLPDAPRSAPVGGSGSVRQVADGEGALQLARSYDPYGNVVSESGEGESLYGYTGEAQENGLVYLRARYYAPVVGRFMARDAWNGDANLPMSYNKWLYTYADPINNIDPSGNTPCNLNQCGAINPSSVTDWYGQCMSGNDRSDCKNPMHLVNSLTNYNPNTNKDKKRPTFLHDTLLSTSKNRLDMSAKDMYHYYLCLWNNKNGYWWRTLGNDTDGFTIWDFISLFTYNESGQSDDKAGLFAEAGVRFFYGREQAMGINNPTVYNLLTWWSYFSQSTSIALHGNAGDDLQLVGSEYGVSSYHLVGYYFEYPPSDWKKGWNFDRPYGWGNLNVLNSEHAKDMYRNHPEAMFFHIPGGGKDGNDFNMPSGCAYYNWNDLDNSLTCPSVKTW